MEPLCTSLARRQASGTTRVARAFTLVEMLVVLAIISVVTMITLYGHSDFDRSILITDTAYTVAISVREMQTFGLSSRVSTSTGISNVGYGIHATKLTGQTSSSYLLFADTTLNGTRLSNCVTGTAGEPDAKPGDCRYTAGSDAAVNTMRLSRGLQISAICGKEIGTGTRRCSGVSDGLQALDAVYMRPNTSAALSGQRADTNAWVALSSGEIYLSTADGTATRAICLSGIGQISVTTTTCP